jgi:pimeloyl-ACP methyl ester carboxylesterase
MAGLKYFLIVLLTVLFHFMVINAGVLPLDYYKDRLNSYTNNNSINNFGNYNGSTIGNFFRGLSRNSNVSGSSTVNTSTTPSNAGGKHDPILFIHGMYSTSSAFMLIINYLASQGWDRNAMYSVDLPDKIGFGPVNAEVISSAANQLLQRTGAQKLNIVCHSMGGANTMNYILNAGGSNKVKKVITLGGANRLVTSSAPSGIEVITISSNADTIVNPILLSRLNGANNIIISGVTHVGLLSSPEVKRLLKENLQ